MVVGIRIVNSGTQECERSLLLSFFCEAKDAWEALLSSLLEHSHSRVTSHTMQGLHLVAYLRNSLVQYLTEVDVSKLKRGCFGFLGNKGAVGTHQP